MENLGKKAKVDFYKDWVEVFFFVLLIIGVLISLAAPSAVLSYLVVLTAGLMAGRLIYERKTKLRVPYFIIIIGFLIGYLIGAVYGKRSVMIILFILGAIISYYAHEKKLLKNIAF